MPSHQDGTAEGPKENEAPTHVSAPVESARLLRSTLDGLASHVAVVDETGTIVFTNKAYRDFAGQNGIAPVAVSEQVNYLAFCDAAKGEDSEYARDFAQGLRDVIAGKRPSFEMEYPCHAPDQQRWFLGRVTRMPGESAGPVVIAHENITDRVVAYATLRKLTRAVEQSDVTIIITDRDGTIEYANPHFEKSSGYTVAEALGQNPRILRSMETPAETYAALWTTVLAGNEWRGEFKNRRKDGTPYWESVVISPVRDENGTITNFVAVKEDITAYKRLAEERGRLQTQLNHVQKIESVGRLAGGIAHDFNNLLTVINGTVELALMSEAPASPHHADFLAIQEAAHRAMALTRQLLTFSRQSAVEPRAVHVNALVTPMRSMLQRMVSEDVVIVTDLAEDAGVVQVDVGQFEQVLTNLSVNARDAMPKGGRITISTARERLVDDESAGILAGEYVRITVRDTGTGMTQAVRDRLFEPFFTTKALGKGTGLGLAIVYGIVTQSGGRVTVESAIGRGTAFHILLPRSERADAGQPEGGNDPIESGAGVILVVDDEPAMGSITQRILQRAGYTVLMAHSGEEALRLADALPGRIDLLVSDVIMPEMNGPETATALRTRDPGLRVLFVSGHSGDILNDHGMGERDYAFLAKPFSVAELSKKVKEVLG